MMEELDGAFDARKGGSELQAHFGRAVRIARQSAGMTQTGLADLAGLTQQYIARIEAGQINPTLATLVAVARVLHLDVGDMLRQVGTPTE